MQKSCVRRSRHVGGPAGPLSENAVESRLLMEMSLPLSEYARLKGVARALLRRERNCTLTGTGLVHELLLKEARSAGRIRLFRVVADSHALQFPFAHRVMRQLLIDRARRRRTRRRCELHTAVGKSVGTQDRASEFVLALDEAITRLGELEPQGAELLRLHFYADVSVEDAAEQLGISRATAYRKWDFCRSWLAVQLKKQ